MTANLFRASVIKKASRHKAFKDLKHRDELAKEAGIRGFSEAQMEKKLKEMGYDPKRRKAVMDHILGGKRQRLSMEEISSLSKDEIKKLPWKERARVKKIKETRKQRNINRAIYERNLEDMEKDKVLHSYTDIAQKDANNISTRRARLGFIGQPNKLGFVNDNQGLITKKTKTVFAGDLNKKSSPSPPKSPSSSSSLSSSGPTIPLAKL